MTQSDSTHRSVLGCAAVLAACGFWAKPGTAQEQRAAPAVEHATYSGSPATKASQSAILPEGRLELGGDLVLVTAERDPEGAELRLTDVGLFGLYTRMAVSSWLELGAGAQLLAKQAESMDEPVWQGASGSLRVPFGDVFAGTVSGGGGPLTHDQGHWWQGESSLLAKLEALEWLRFELRGGYMFTSLHYSDDSSPTSLQELVTHAEVQFGEKYGGAWIGIDYYVPVHSDSEPGPSGRPALDSNVRLNLELGAVLTPPRTGWDLFVSYAIIDRGDVESPETTLPVLNGGFDQTRWAIGVQHHFDLYRAEKSGVLSYE
jgi:hypothetical protein